MVILKEKTINQLFNIWPLSCEQSGYYSILEPLGQKVTVHKHQIYPS